MTVQLVGEGRRFGKFLRGLSQYPTVSDPVHLVTEQDLAKIYGRPDEPQAIAIGQIASSESIPALVDLDKLITRHSAVVGTTGAGKSTTVAGYHHAPNTIIMPLHLSTICGNLFYAYDYTMGMFVYGVAVPVACGWALISLFLLFRLKSPGQ